MGGQVWRGHVAHQDISLEMRPTLQLKSGLSGPKAHSRPHPPQRVHGGVSAKEQWPCLGIGHARTTTETRNGLAGSTGINSLPQTHLAWRPVTRSGHHLQLVGNCEIP